MTSDEMAALPVGPFETHRRELTEEDYVAGKRGRYVETTVAREVMATAWNRDDIACWTDDDGRQWSFGRYADGSWFRQPVRL